MLVVVSEHEESGEMLVSRREEEMVGCAVASNIQRTRQFETYFQTGESVEAYNSGEFPQFADKV